MEGRRSIREGRRRAREGRRRAREGRRRAREGRRRAREGERVGGASGEDEGYNKWAASAGQWGGNKTTLVSPEFSS